MNCTSFNKWSSQALDGELDGEKTKRFEAHLRLCPWCRRKWEQLKQLPALVTAYPSWEVSAKEDQAIRSIWRPSLRPDIALHPQNLFTGNWPKVFWQFRLAGVLTGSILALITLMTIPIQVARLQFQLERIMQADNPIYFHARGPVTRNSGFRTQIENQTVVPLVSYNQELYEGTRRFNNYTVNRFTEYESAATQEDSFAVLTFVTPEGHSSIQDVLRTPRDWNLMQRFGQLLADSKLNGGGSSSQNSGVIIRSFQRVLVIG